MERIALHLEVRNALSLADELGRHEHALGNDVLAGHLAALRSAFRELERQVGRSYAEDAHPEPALIEAIQHSVATLRSRRSEIPRSLRMRFAKLVAAADRVRFALARPGKPVPSMPLLGVLPRKRLVPSLAHTVIDYLAAAAYAASAVVARTKRGRAVGAVLGAKVAGVSLITDRESSAAKILPIELHEVLDHTSGALAVAAPFVLGYVRRDPLASAIQVATGFAVVLTSLFTDYRATAGRTWPIRSRGGPHREIESEAARISVVNHPRPLEGLSAAPTDWLPDAEPQ